MCFQDCFKFALPISCGVICVPMCANYRSNAESFLSPRDVRYMV